MEKENIVWFRPQAILDANRDCPSNEELGTPTLGVLPTILSPDLCKAIYNSGKFNKFIPTYFWQVEDNTKFVKYGLLENTKKLWVDYLFETGGHQPLKVIPAYTTSELYRMLPYRVDIFGIGQWNYLSQRINHEQQTIVHYGNEIYGRSESEVESRGHLLIKLIEQSLV